MTKLNEYVKTAEAAEIHGASQNTVHSWAEAGKVPTRRTPANANRLFSRADLVRFPMQIERQNKAIHCK